MKSNSSSQSNSKSEDTSLDDDYQAVQRILLDWNKGYRPLSGEVRDILAWHKAEIAKLFEQIRSEVIGDDEYPDEHFPVYLGHKDDALAKKFDEVVTRDRLKTKQREALTRLEKK